MRSFCQISGRGAERRALQACRASVSGALIYSLLTLAVCVLTVATAGPAYSGEGGRADDEQASTRIGNDLYIAAENLSIDEPVGGDLYAAGYTIIVRKEIAGDVMATGYVVDLSALVRDDVRAWGRDVRILSGVGGDVAVAGKTVVIGSDAVVGGDVVAAGDTVALEGTVGGNVRLIGEEVVINGRVDGDASVRARQIQIGPDAAIAGTLTYYSDREPDIDSEAVLGAVEHAGGKDFDEDYEDEWGGGGIWFLAMVFVTAAALTLIFPNAGRDALQATRSEPWKALGLGIAGLVGSPIFAMILFFTIIGLVLGLAVFALYGAAVIAGLFAAVWMIGDLVLSRFRPNDAPGRGWRIGAVGIGSVLLSLLGGIPFLGGLVTFIALSFGIGAIALIIAARINGRPTVPPESEPAGGSVAASS